MSEKRTAPLFLALLWLFVGTMSNVAQVLAQDVPEYPGVAKVDELFDTTKHPVAVTMALQADSFFGFNPSVYGTYGLSKDFALAWNFTYWTDLSGFGAHNANPWLELDLGVNMTFWDKRISITPMVGTVHGCLLSSRCSTFPNGGGSRNERSTVFDGIVPNITVNYLDNRVEGEFYMGYYKALREEGGQPGPQASDGIGPCGGSGQRDCLGPNQAGGRGSWDFLHWWVNGGYRINSLFSVGGHYEQLLTTRDNSAFNAAQDYYRWVGPYVEMKLPGNMAFRFTAGKDLASEQDFYKLKFTKTF